MGLDALKTKLEQEIVLLDSILSSKKRKVVKIGAEWCQPCQRLKPYFKESKERNTDIDFFDIDLGRQGDSKNQNISQFFSVRGIPAVFLLSEDNEVIGTANDPFNFMEEFLKNDV